MIWQHRDAICSLTWYFYITFVYVIHLDYLMAKLHIFNYACVFKISFCIKAIPHVIFYKINNARKVYLYHKPIKNNIKEQLLLTEYKTIH